MMRFKLIFYLSFLYCCISAQVYYGVIYETNSGYSVITFNDSCKFDKLCTSVSANGLTIAFDPLGNTYLAIFNQFESLENRYVIVKYDLEQCRIIDTVLTNLNFLSKISFDFKGNIYGYDFIYNIKTKVKLFTPPSLNFFTYKNGHKIILDLDTLSNSLLFRNTVTMENFIDTALIAPLFPSGLVSKTEKDACNSSKLLLSGYEYPQGIYNIWEYDLSTKSKIKLCSNIPELFSIDSPDAFLSSDPECDLLIDLDRDNSSGVYPYDYKAQLTCGAGLYPIVDSDLYVHTAREDNNLTPAIDSITLELTDIKDVGQESLTYMGNHPSVQLVKSSATKYVLKFINDVVDTVVRDALKNIFYLNTADPITNGQRGVKIQGYSDLKKGVEVMAYLPMYARPDGGRDTCVSYCDALKIADMKSVIGTTSNGLWQPPLNTNNQYDSKYDVEAKYTFITKDSVCGVDSAQVSISKLPNPITLLPQDTTLCKGEMLQVTLNTSDQIKWGDGDTKKIKSIGQGVHKLTIKNIFGCATEDTLVILPSNKKIPIQKSIALCENDTYSFDGKIYKAGQKITYVSPSETTCDSLIEISLVLSPNAIGQKDTMTCDNQPIIYQNKMYKIGDTIVYRKLNNTKCDSLIYMVYKSKNLETYTIKSDRDSICDGALAQLTASEGKSYIWSTGSTSQTISVPSGKYQLTITDAAGCAYTLSKDIAVYPQKEINLEIMDTSCDEDNGSIILKTQNLTDIKLDGKPSTAIMTDLKAGEHMLSFKDRYGCQRSRIIEIEERPLRLIELLSQYIINKGDSIYIKAEEDKIQGATSPQAEVIIGNSYIILVPKSKGNITIEIQDKEGCIYKLNTEVIYESSMDILVPNIIRLEGGTINSNWTVLLEKGQEIKHCEIIDRWGNKVYDSKTEANWDGSFNGKVVEPGVYLYQILIRTKEGQDSYKRGDITVVK